MPTAVVLHPSDAEGVDTLKVNAEVNKFGSIDLRPGRPLWGMSRVTSEACPVGTATVADWRYAALFDRDRLDRPRHRRRRLRAEHRPRPVREPGRIRRHQAERVRRGRFGVADRPWAGRS